MVKYFSTGIAALLALLISLSSKAQTELGANSNLTGETGGSSYSLPDFSIRFSSPFSLPINPNSQMTQDYLELQGRTSMFHSGIIVTPLVNSYEPENTLGVVLNPGLEPNGSDPLARIRGMDSLRWVPRPAPESSGNKLLFSSPNEPGTKNTLLYGTPFLDQEPSNPNQTNGDSLSVPAANPFGDPYPATDSSWNTNPAGQD